MKRSSFFLLPIIAVMLILNSCTTRIGDFTVISTKNAELGQKYVQTGTYEAEDMAWIIIFIPTGIPNLKTAVDKCIEAGNGVLITNCVLSLKQFWFIIGQQGYLVKGDVWKRASTGDLNDPSKEIFELAKSTNGGFELVSVNNPQKKLAVADPNNPNTIKVAIQ